MGIFSFRKRQVFLGHFSTTFEEETAVTKRVALGEERSCHRMILAQPGIFIDHFRQPKAACRWADISDVIGSEQHADKAGFVMLPGARVLHCEWAFARSLEKR